MDKVNGRFLLLSYLSHLILFPLLPNLFSIMFKRSRYSNGSSKISKYLYNVIVHVCVRYTPYIYCIAKARMVDKKKEKRARISHNKVKILCQ